MIGACNSRSSLVLVILVFLSEVGSVRAGVFSLQYVHLLWTSGLIWQVQIVRSTGLHKTLDQSSSVWSMPSVGTHRSSLVRVGKVVVNWLLSWYVRVLQSIDMSSSNFHAFKITHLAGIVDLHQSLNHTLSVWCMSAVGSGSCGLAWVREVVENWLLSRDIWILKSVDVSSTNFEAL